MGKKLVIVVASWEGNWEARGGGARSLSPYTLLSTSVFTHEPDKRVEGSGLRVLARVSVSKRMDCLRTSRCQARPKANSPRLIGCVIST